MKKRYGKRTYPLGLGRSANLRQLLAIAAAPPVHAVGGKNNSNQGMKKSIPPPLIWKKQTFRIKCLITRGGLVRRPLLRRPTRLVGNFARTFSRWLGFRSYCLTAPRSSVSRRGTDFGLAVMRCSLITRPTAYSAAVPVVSHDVKGLCCALSGLVPSAGLTPAPSLPGHSVR